MPTRIEEIAEMLAVNTAGKPWFHYDAGLFESKEILTMCSGFEIYKPDDYNPDFNLMTALVWGLLV